MTGAITPRRKFADALEQIGNLLLLEPQLRRVVDVLILAAAARAEVAARRLDALRRRLHDAQQPRARKILFHLRDFHFDGFADQHERHEHDKIVHAPDAFAAERDVVDGQTQTVADLQWHKRRLKRAGPLTKTIHQRSYFALRVAMAAFICSK